jgi:hypothetical protein
MRRHTQPRKWLLVFGLAGAFFAVLPLAIGAGFLHSDAPGSEATCSICHVMHIPALPFAWTQMPVGVTTIEWLIPPAVPIVHDPSTTLNSSPRAPPH